MISGVFKKFSLVNNVRRQQPCEAAAAVTGAVRETSRVKTHAAAGANVYTQSADCHLRKIELTSYAMESGIFDPRVAPNSSDSKEENRDKSQLSVPALHLITSLICGHQHNLHQVETKLKEILQHQEVLSDGVQSENERFKTAEATFHLPSVFQEISTYNQKLIQLKSEMAAVTERTSRLKKRAMRLQQQQQQKALNQEQERAQQAEREKHLIAQPVWATKHNDS